MAAADSKISLEQNPSYDHPIPNYALAWHPSIQRPRTLPLKYDTRIPVECIFYMPPSEEDPDAGQYVVSARCDYCARCGQACSRTRPTCDLCLARGHRCKVSCRKPMGLPGPKIAKPTLLKKSKANNVIQTRNIPSKQIQVDSELTFSVNGRSLRPRRAPYTPSSAHSLLSRPKQQPRSTQDPIHPEITSISVQTKATKSKYRNSTLETHKRRLQKRLHTRDLDAEWGASAKKGSLTKVSESRKKDNLKVPSKSGRRRSEKFIISPISPKKKASWKVVEPPPEGASADVILPLPKSAPRIWASTKAELCDILPEYALADHGVVWKCTDTPVLFLEGKTWMDDSWDGGKVIEMTMVREFSCDVSELHVQTQTDPDRYLTPLPKGSVLEASQAEPSFVASASFNRAHGGFIESLSLVTVPSSSQPGQRALVPAVRYPHMAPMPSLPNSSNPVPQDPDRNSTQTNLQFIYFRKETRPGQSGGSTASNMPFRVCPAVSSSSLPQPSSNVSSPSLSSHANHPSPNTICDGLPSVQMTSATDTARITPTDHDLVTPQAPPSYGIPSPVNTMFRLPFLPTPSAQEVHFSEITDLVQVRINSPDLSDCMQLFDPYAGHKNATLPVDRSASPDPIDLFTPSNRAPTPAFLLTPALWPTNRAQDGNGDVCRCAHANVRPDCLQCNEKGLRHDVVESEVGEGAPPPVAEFRSQDNDSNTRRPAVSTPISASMIPLLAHDRFIPKDLPAEINALIQCRELQMPISIVLCSDSSLSAFTLPEGCGCAFLGFFHLTDLQVHAEDLGPDTDTRNGACTTTGRNGRVRWRFRFEWTPGGESACPDPSSNFVRSPWWMSNDTCVNDPNTASSRDTDGDIEMILHPYTLLPLHLIAAHELSEEQLASSSSEVNVSRGWWCASCGKMNVQQCLRYQKCSKCQEGNRLLPIGVQYVRNQYGVARVSFPQDRYADDVECKTRDGVDGLRNYTYKMHGSAVVQHLFTCNLEHAQTEPTLLFKTLQADIEISWERSIKSKATSSMGPVYSYLIEGGHAGAADIDPWANAPECISKAKELLLRRARGPHGDTLVNIQQLTVVAWLTSGRKSGCAFYAKKSPVVMLCLGADVELTISPKSGKKGRPRYVAEKPVTSHLQDDNNFEPFGLMDVDDEVEDSNVDRYIHESISSAMSNKGGNHGKSRSTEEALLVTLVHGDILIVAGDEFEYSIKRTGMSIVLIGSDI